MKPLVGIELVVDQQIHHLLTVAVAFIPHKQLHVITNTINPIYLGEFFRIFFLDTSHKEINNFSLHMKRINFIISIRPHSDKFIRNIFYFPGNTCGGAMRSLDKFQLIGMSSGNNFDF